MKIRQKFVFWLGMGTAGIGLAVIATVYFVLLPCLGEIEKPGDLWNVSVFPPFWPIYWKLALFAALILSLLYTTNSMRAFRKRVLDPMFEATRFSYDLGNGKFPAPFVIDATKNAEMNELFKSLNIIRDRLISNANRLRSSHNREAEARRESENTAELKSMLISRMAPDMRVPLNSIAGYVELLQYEITHCRAKADFDGEALLRGVRRNVKVLVAQIDRLLKIGSIGQNNLQVNFQTFETAEFMTSLLKQNEFLLSERAVKLKIPFSSSAPATIRTDREILTQLLALMIRGVARASNSGETIRCFCLSERNQIEFHVADSRKAPCRERLAEAYTLARKDSNLGNIESASTTVLGMIFIDTQAAMIGGKLTAESSTEASSEFVLSFSQADIAAEKDPRDDRTQTFHVADTLQSEQLEHADATEPEEEEGAEPYRILLGEEDADNAEVLRRVLEHNHFRVECGENAAELLKLAANERFDAAILSNAMRHRNMVVTIRKILHQSEQTRLPIIVLASKMNTLKQAQLHNAGVRCVMMKPIDFPMLVRKLRQICRQGDN